MRKVLLISLSLLLVAPNYPQSSERRAVMNVVHDFLKAYRTQNLNLLLSLISKDIYTIWSSGYTVKGYAAHQKAYYRSFTEFKSFHSQWQTEQLVVQGNHAWVVGVWTWQAKMAPVQKTVEKQVHTTLIFRKSAGKWKITHEHSSLISKKVYDR